MLMDTSGQLGREHVRDLHKAADLYRESLGAHRTSVLRRLARRSQLGPAYNYRAR